jgi:aryl-alcohol dehydrogenase-like predicted oxidoreductase
MKFALGTVQFGLSYGVANTSGQVSSEVVASILQIAERAGINTLDTGISYGESERVLGNVGVRSWNVVTKLPALPSECIDVNKWVKEKALDSLRLMGLNKLHGLLLHHPSQILQDYGDELYSALQSLKSDGLVTKVGISIYRPEELEAICSRYTFDLVQAPLNILDRRLVDSGWAEKLEKVGVEVHTRSAFLQGLLLMTSNERPSYFHQWSEIWSVWDSWLLTTGLSPLQACLGYVNSISNVSRVVIGVDTDEQLRQILLAANIEFK